MPETEGTELEFRLIYKGSLPAQGKGGSRVKEKHAIRRQFHPQLRELWSKQQLLRGYTQETDLTKRVYIDQNAGADEKATGLDFIAKTFTKFGYRFVPLIGSFFGIACSLDILFLRRDGPGNLIVSGGDIDNRIKVLFDGLKIPGSDAEVANDPPQSGEDPFFCLLEDDALITDVKITTDRLLTPQESEEHIHDVHLVLHIKTKIVDINKGFSVFA
jgi:hypothetical protein